MCRCKVAVKTKSCSWIVPNHSFLNIIKYYFLKNFLPKLATLLKLNFLQVFLKRFAKLRVNSHQHLIHAKYLMASYNSFKLLLKRRWSCSFSIRGKSRNSAICGMKFSASILHSCKIWIWMLDVTGFINWSMFVWFQCF